MPSCGCRGLTHCMVCPARSCDNLKELWKCLQTMTVAQGCFPRWHFERNSSVFVVTASDGNQSLHVQLYARIHRRQLPEYVWLPLRGCFLLTCSATTFVCFVRNYAWYVLFMQLMLTSAHLHRARMAAPALMASTLTHACACLDTMASTARVHTKPFIIFYWRFVYLQIHDSNELCIIGHVLKLWLALSLQLTLTSVRTLPVWMVVSARIVSTSTRALVLLATEA